MSVGGRLPLSREQEGEGGWGTVVVGWGVGVGFFMAMTVLGGREWIPAYAGMTIGG